MKTQLFQIFKHMAFTTRVSLSNKSQISVGYTNTIIADLDLKIRNVYPNCDAGSFSI